MIEAKQKIVIAGGGTGGHLYPAIAIAEEIQKSSNYEVIFFGSKYGIESDILKKYSNKYYLFNIRGIQRSLSLRSIAINILFPFRFIISFIKTFLLFIKINPIMVIGTGGYASGVPLIIAVLLKKRILIQEQNSMPGLTTKKISKYAEAVCVAYNSISNEINGKIILTGNPIRSNLVEMDKNKARALLNIKNRFTLLVIGGSQGSKAINEFILKYKNDISNDINIVWICGRKNYNTIKDKIYDDNILLKSYSDDINIEYSASDIIITRAGALALSEISLFNKPMIIVPIPCSFSNHQFINAKYFENKGAALVVEENAIKLIIKYIHKLKESTKLIKDMERNSKKISYPNASKDIIKVIEKIIIKHV